MSNVGHYVGRVDMRLLTAAEAAERLAVTPRTIARWANAGRLEPVVRAPGRRGARLFDPAAVDRLARQVQARN